MNSNETTQLFNWIVKAIEMGVSELEIEYKDGYEEITAMSGNMGVGIGRMNSNSKEAKLLRKELYTIRKKKTITVADKKYTIKIKIYDSFGEDAFSVIIAES